jgi:hypothetical protein
MCIGYAVIIIIVKTSYIFLFDLTNSDKITQTNWLTYQQFGLIYEFDVNREIYNLSFFWTIYYEAAIIVSASLYMIFLMRLLRVSEKMI